MYLYLVWIPVYLALKLCFVDLCSWQERFPTDTLNNLNEYYTYIGETVKNFCDVIRGMTLCQIIVALIVTLCCEGIYCCVINYLYCVVA